MTNLLLDLPPDPDDQAERLDDGAEDDANFWLAVDRQFEYAPVPEWAL